MNPNPLLIRPVSILFLRYVSLSVLSMTGMSLYVLADTFFIANRVGSGGLTALNLVLPVYSLLNGTGLMLAMGASAHYSILSGRQDGEGGNRVFTQALILVLWIGAIVTAAGILSARSLSALLGAEGEILVLATQYLRTLLAFSLAFLANTLLVCFIRNDGSPNLSMTAMMVGSLSNVVLDYLFLYPLNLGMFGAAFATGLAPIISLMILSTHFLRKNSRFHLISCRPTLRETGRILSLGLPSFITEFSSGIVMLLFNFTILTIAGDVGIAAYGIIANLALIAVAMFTGIAQGMQPLISLHCGANLQSRIHSILIRGLLTSLICGLLFFLIGQFFSAPITAWFNRDGDEILSEIAQQGIRIYFFAFLPMGINIVTSAFFASADRPVQSFFLSILRGLAAIIVFLLILPRLFGLRGVFAVVPCTELLTFLLSCSFLLRRKPDVSS